MSSKQVTDQGYAWVILAAVFFSAVFTFGGTKAFGVFYVEFLDVYGEGSGTTAWIVSFSMGLMLGCGVLVTWLTNRFTVRSVMIVGGLLTGVGHFVSAYVLKLEMLYATYGLLTGLGRGLCFTPSLFMVNTYFVRRRALANGLAFAGSGMGSFVLPFVTRFVLNMYGLKGALLVFSGLTLNLCVCGALMRPSIPRKNQSKNLHYSDDEKKATDMEKRRGEVYETNVSHQHPELLLPFRSDQHDILSIEGVDKKAFDEDYKSKADLNSCAGVGTTTQGYVFAIDRGDGIKMDNQNMALNVSLPHDTQHLIQSDWKVERSATIDVLPERPRPIIGSDTLVSSCQSFSQINGASDIVRPVNGDEKPSQRTVPVEVYALIDCSRGSGDLEGKTKVNSSGINDALNSTENLSVSSLRQNDFYHDYKDKSVESGLNQNAQLHRTNSKMIQHSNPPERTSATSNSLCLGPCALTNPVFIVMESAFVLLTFGYLAHFTMLPAHAVDIGFSKPQADVLLSAIGLADIVGRISVGWFSDLLWIPRNLLAAILAILGGISALLIPWSRQYWMLCAYATAVGFLPGSGSVIIFVSMTERLGTRMNPSVFGIHSTLFALPALFSPPITGWLKDWTGSWNVSFCVVGSCMLLSCGIVSFVAPIVLKRYAKKYQAVS